MAKKINLKTGKQTTDTVELSNGIKIIIDIEKIVIKNSYFSVSYSNGTNQYLNFTEMVKSHKEKDEESTRLLVILTNAIVAFQGSVLNPDMLNHVAKFFEDKI